MTEFEIIPNPTKKGKKWDYHKDVNATPLPKDILKTLRDNALKYTKTKEKKKGGQK
jgi:hypothetical protein